MSTKQFSSARDVYCRLNFLFQASMLTADFNNTLSSHYGNIFDKIREKCVLQIAPDIKRWICRKCFLYQKPGQTADIEIVSVKSWNARRRRRRKNIDQNALIKVTCRQCGYARNLTVNSNYKFWLENPDAIYNNEETENDENSQLDSDKSNTNMISELANI